MSHQAVTWALYKSPMLHTDKGNPDTTARQILAVLAEHADENGVKAHPSNLRIRWATGYDERTIQRALLRLERADLIARDGITREGVVKWRLNLAMERPESDLTDLEDEADRVRQVESDRRRARRDRAKSVDVSGTDSAGHIQDDLFTTGDVRDGNSRRPGRRMPASGTETPGVRDATPPEPPMNLQGTTKGSTTGGTLPPDPLRPLSPSGQGNEHHDSLSTRGDQPQEVIGNSRPHARETEVPCPSVDPSTDTPPPAPTKTDPPATAPSAPASSKAAPTPRRHRPPRSTTTGQPQPPDQPPPSAPEPPSPPAANASPPPPLATATPAASDWPIVHIRQSDGRPPEPAELREDNPERPTVVKIVYLHSRTSAWVARTRIVTPQEHAA